MEWQFLSALVLQTAFIGAMAQNTPARAIAFVVIAGIGIDWCQTAGIIIVQVGVPDRDIGVATGSVIPGGVK
jgi:hypothetical protein